jgi:LmbE family N-acetylglucosaminyl deacetylase
VNLFVQPHFDDAALSCGGTIAGLEGQPGGTIILTVFAGGPAPGTRLGVLATYLHERWGTGSATLSRRDQEDRRAAQILGARRCTLPFPEAIYRGDRYDDWTRLFGPVHPDELELQQAIAGELLSHARALAARAVFLPLALGGHVDHRIVAAAAGPLAEAGLPVLLYEDFPYALRERPLAGAPLLIDVTATLGRRVAAIAAYRSQRALVFEGRSPRRVVCDHARALGGARCRYAERFFPASASSAVSI